MNRAKRRKTVTVTYVVARGLIVNVAMVALKLFGGVFGASHALLADAVHSLTDVFSDLALLWAASLWDKVPDSSHQHGHKRLELLVTLLMGLVLAATAVGISYRALHAHLMGHREVVGGAAAVCAGIAIIVKELLYRWTIKRGRALHSLPLIANAWHHRSDALSSVPVLFVIVLATTVPGWQIVDVIGAFLVAGLLFRASIKMVIEPWHKLMDGGMPELEQRQIEAIAKGTAGVREVRRLRTRYIGAYDVQVDCTILVDACLSVDNGHRIAEDACRKIQAAFPGVHDVVVHVEPWLKNG